MQNFRTICLTEIELLLSPCMKYLVVDHIKFVAMATVQLWLRHRCREQNVPSSIPRLGISVEVTF